MLQTGGYLTVKIAEHYNYFRDYDPGIGRYVQSDPIGLRGSINTYGYVDGAPLIQFDELGLMGRGGSPNGGASPWCGPRPTAGCVRKPNLRPDGQPWGYGCGDEKSDWIVPDSYDGADFLPACRRHDTCYETCGANKGACDRGLYSDLVTACNRAGKFGGRCPLVARAYLGAMSTQASQDAFIAAQKKCKGCK